MIQITAQMRIRVALAPVDFRKGIDALAGSCRRVLGEDPYSGAVFVFCNRSRTAVRVLVYDGQGFWLCQKRMSAGKFRYWPRGVGEVGTLLAHELGVLLCGGDPQGIRAAPQWRALGSSG